MRVSAGVAEKQLIHKAKPEYPEDAKKAKVKGEVRLRILIDEEGKVSDVKVLKGDPRLADAATEAVKQWRYRPMILSGEAVEVDTEVGLKFP